MTETQARKMRLDRKSFKRLEDAIKFGEENHLQIRNVYKYPSGVYKICRYVKGPAEKMGSFINGKYVKYVPEDDVKKPDKTLSINKKFVDINKVKEYFNHPDCKYSRYEIGPMIYKSKAYINDVLRYRVVNIAAFDRVCDILNVPHDYFDLIEEDSESVVEEEVTETKEFNCELIHDDLMSLIASNRRLEILMQQMIEMWKND